ncbi:MAG: glycine dehydrogenase (aminomethyl-transferring) [Verrucomicrobia bacterium]|nr:MAG: glycine dehydrogenase (aminomethyl-transferring) [Verrucomicrobiota bacterium]
MKDSSPTTTDNDLRGADPDAFLSRHLGPRPGDIRLMLRSLGLGSLDELVDQAIPPEIRLGRELALPAPLSEAAALRRLRELAALNRPCRSFLGMGYHDTHLPGVIRRNVLENPGWYTAYTPYQSEISQGRLEAMLNFQTMVCDLTGMAIANASLLDEATAAAEAMMMCRRLKARENRHRFWIAADAHPQVIEVVQTRARPLGIEVIVAIPEEFAPDAQTCGVLLASPATDGRLRDLSALIERARQAGALAVVDTDLLALTLLTPPGEQGADIVIGSAQRFGVPMWYGGPHAAFLATRDEFKRQMPGRLVGVSRDARGRPALRLALGTREQHIRRDKATSNICTAQALLACIAAFYAVWHGPEGLQAIARRVHGQAAALAEALRQSGWQVRGEPFFDTIRVEAEPERIAAVIENARKDGLLLRRLDEGALTIALDETTEAADLAALVRVFGGEASVAAFAGAGVGEGEPDWPEPLRRRSPFLTAPVFHRYRSETEMMRYLKRLESRDLSLTASMIPLGSCTMKLNPAAAMMAIGWGEWTGLHPFAPREFAEGYHRLFEELGGWLAEITGLPGVSFQPNAGSQGEYTGLLVIRAWHESRGEGRRDVCLIPMSAHGTNPASAVMAGLRVVPVPCDPRGNVDVGRLRELAEQHADRLAALMITYPSTHGVFESRIREISEIVHAHGGQLYLDGANMNAQVGLMRPAEVGADVCHLNLHKTFAIPHGGGGPGMGPICVAEHLRPFLPGHSVAGLGGPQSIGAVAAAPWGSAGILPIAWFYIACLGAEGLRRASEVAILNANYVARRLEGAFPVLYRGRHDRVAHECILDLRRYKTVTAEDVAKRLMDYGFHAPTLSWPVAGTLMVEPTESESRQELDRFCDAMLAIHAEILAIEDGRLDPRDNPLKNAPHTADMIAETDWPHPYTREQAVFPAPALREFKYWPPVARVDNVFGDRNPLCTCAGMEAIVRG